MYTRRFSWRSSSRSSSSSSSDDDIDAVDDGKQQKQKQNRRQSYIEMIDLTDSNEPIMCNTISTTTATPTASSTMRKSLVTYVPHTLKTDSLRWSILPAFPTSIYDEQSPALLLANVPVTKLDLEQRTRRQSGHYDLVYTVDKNKCDIPSYFREYHLLFMNSLIKQYKIDESILDYNLYRFSQCYQKFTNEFIRLKQYSPEDFVLSDKQKRYAFEFYLQIDVDVFFMKTCSFRRAQPRSIDEGLFCMKKPRVQYFLSPCHRCSLCRPSYNLANRERLGPMVQFDMKRSLKFYNGYRAYLNCPAKCQTSNLIYVMTCPCRQFEYIGETGDRLNDRLKYHRQHFNRIFHEFLLGEQNIKLAHPQEKDQETIAKDRMLLYRHAVRCPSAMQIFLNFNPIYWCFAPLTLAEVEIQNRINPTLPSSLISLDSVFPTSIASKEQRHIHSTTTTRSDERVRRCMRNLPPIPGGYDFSIQQRAQQFQYFKHQHDLTDKQNSSMDLFNVAIVAVLPEDASKNVRRFVEALFITHTEAKLNTSGRLIPLQSLNATNAANYPQSTSQPINPALLDELQLLDREEWCLDLIFPHHDRERYPY